MFATQQLTQSNQGEVDKSVTCTLCQFP